MPQEDSRSPVVRFGAFTFDPQVCELRKGDTRLKVPDQSLEILKALLERRGQLVTRDDLRQRLWGPDTFVDFEAGLNAAVRRLRDALNDSADEPAFIETLPRRGYRFIGEITRPPDVMPAVEDPVRVAAARRGANEGIRPVVQETTARARSSWAWAGVAFVTAVALAGAYIAWTARTPGDVAGPREVALTTLLGAETSPTLAPDGEQVAFAWSGPKQDNPDIYVQRIGSGTEVRRTSDPAWDFNPVWSPDGRWIAFLRGEVPGRSEVMLMPPLGGAERRLGEIHIPNTFVLPPYLAWLPDSSALIVVHAASPQETEALFVMSAKTGELRRLTEATLAYPHQQPAVSPDGRTVVFWKRGAQLCLVGLTNDLRASPEPTTLGNIRAAVQPTWTPDGKQIVYSDGQMLWRIDAVKDSHPEPLSYIGRNAIMPVIARATPGRPGRLVYVQRKSDQNLWRLDLAGIGTPTADAGTVFHSSTRIDYNAQFSPDGRRVAFQSNRAGDMEIWVGDSDGGNAAQLTELRGPNSGTPRWSPDGQTIAFDTSVDRQYEIYVIAAGGGKPRRLTFDPTEDVIPSFSSDGRFIYFSSRRSGSFEIWKIPVSGGDAVQVTRNGGVVAFESPDGRYLYYTPTSTGPSALWRVATAGGEAEHVIDGVSKRAFVVLENGIYYIEELGASRSEWAFDLGQGFLGEGTRARLRYFDFASRTSRVISDLSKRVGLGLGVSPDGRTIVFTTMENPSSDLMMVENFR